MKILLIVLLTVVFVWITATCGYAQTYNEDNFAGTSTVENLKANHTVAQIRNMLEDAEILRNVKNKAEFGFVLTDPNTSGQTLICKSDTTALLFEYIKKLKQEIVTLKQRLQAAGIP